jgi:hypothetical protein
MRQLCHSSQSGAHEYFATPGSKQVRVSSVADTQDRFERIRAVSRS